MKIKLTHKCHGKGTTSTHLVTYTIPVKVWLHQAFFSAWFLNFGLYFGVVFSQRHRPANSLSAAAAVNGSVEGQQA